MKWFKKFIHTHDYEKIGYRQTEDAYERYSIRNYKCKTCGKEVWVDGRHDYIDK